MGAGPQQFARGGRGIVGDRRSGLAGLALRLEAPTWILAFTIYGGWLALTLCWNEAPVWLVAPAGAWLCAWHMSLQHELIHGHPTRNRRINAALATPPLNLWLPYPIYREQHLRHHCDTHLTDPLEDPESTYLSAQDWARAGPVSRILHLASNTLAGRLLLGPAVTIAQFWLRQARIGQQDAPRLVWLAHAFWVLLILAWLSLICRISLASYVTCFVYPGTALTLVRSLAEHRAAFRPGDRTAIVERGGLLGLLFLYNNLHVLHHDQPSIPWYELPAAWRRNRPRLLRSFQGPLYRDYLDVAVRYALRPHHPGPHPGSTTDRAASCCYVPAGAVPATVVSEA
jgi:fatty acid desaturase